MYVFCKKDPGTQVSSNEISRYLSQLSIRQEEWQVQQAREAISLYMFFQRRKSVCGVKHKANPDSQWKVFADEMVRMLRLKHRSLSTEKTYLSWLRSFYQFLKGKSPDDLDGSDVKDFLTYLAAERKVAHSTQNQAFNALLFFIAT